MISPIQITLLNDRHLPILFIPDGQQNLLIEVENDSGEDVTFDPAKDFHLQLLFRPKTLRDPKTTLKLVRTEDDFPHDSDLKAAALEGKDWNDAIITENVPGPVQGMTAFFTLTLKANGRAPLPNGKRFSLLFSGAMPEVTSEGTRLSRVEIQHQLMPGLSLPLVAHLHLLNISEFAFLAQERDNSITSARSLPFAADFAGSNQVFNDNATQAALTLRIFNIQDAPLQVSANSELEVSWFLTGSPAEPGALTDPGKMTVESPTQSFWKPVDKINESNGVGSRNLKPVLVTSPFPQHQASTVSLTFTVPSTVPAGFAPLMLAWRNLPDAADGQLTLLVRIGDLVVDQTDHTVTRIVSQKPLRFDAGNGLEFGSFNAADTFLTMRTAGGNKYRSGVQLRVYNDQLGFDIENDDRIASEGLNISRLDAGATSSSLFISRLNGNVGLGTTAPRSRLEVQTNTGGETPILTLTNRAGGQGTSAALDFNTYDTGSNASSRIEAIDDGNASNHIRFLANKPGAHNNGLVERLKIGSDGSFFLNGQKPFMTRIYQVAANGPDIPTNVSSADYTAILAGFKGLSTSAATGLAVLPQVHQGFWIISCHLEGGVDTGWEVFILFIRNEILDRQGFFQN
jgi:hypothetical protein